MPPAPLRQCITPGCGTLVKRGRCPKCQKLHRQQRDRLRGPRPYYNSREYKQRAAEVRERAMLCWLCGQAAKFNDPWQADHYIPRDQESPLLPAHRTCNARRGNRNATPHPDWVHYATVSADPVLAIVLNWEVVGESGYG